jgi:DNA anti-recombination protein RmuC
MPRAARTTRKKTEVLSESTSLEFHVDKCGERYKQMNEKLDNLSKRIDEESKSSDHKFEILFRKVDDLMMKMTENQASQNKMLIGLLAGIIIAIIGAWLTHMM